MPDIYHIVVDFIAFDWLMLTARQDWSDCIQLLHSANVLHSSLSSANSFWG
jgi:hypothetical protein